MHRSIVLTNPPDLEVRIEDALVLMYPSYKERTAIVIDGTTQPSGTPHNKSWVMRIISKLDGAQYGIIINGAQYGIYQPFFKWGSLNGVA